SMLIAVLLLLSETLHSNQRSKANLFAVFKTFGSLIKDHFFFGIALAQAFVSMSMFAYIAGSPFVLQNVYGASAQQFSFIFAMNGNCCALAPYTFCKTKGEPAM